MTSGSHPKSSSQPWRSIVGWLIALTLLAFVVVTIVDLNKRLLPHSFAILYPENGGRNALLLLLGAVGLIALTSYFGKLWGERTRQGRKINYWAIMTDQLTHLFFWIFILIALYPIIFVVSASFDPRNTLTDASLGDVGPLIVRAKVLPTLEGKDFSNYEALFKGVVIQVWQYLGLGVFVLGILGIAVLWFMVQANGGKVTPSMNQNLNPNLLGDCAWLGCVFWYARTFAIYRRRRSRGEILTLVKKHFYHLEHHGCADRALDHHGGLCHGSFAFSWTF